MVPEKEIKDKLNGWVDDLIGRSPFFHAWKPGQVGPSLSEKFLVSFDSLVKSFPALIAAGLSRMTDETTRTVLAVNLYQECGEGDVRRTHHAIYRKFLSTAGLPAGSSTEDPFSAQWRNGLFEYIQQTPSVGAVLGALAAGEFLAQPALSRIYQALQPHYPEADQEYFTKHLVLEEDHVREITSLIALQAKDGKGWNEVQEGFRLGLSAWEEYFEQLSLFLALEPSGSGK